MNQLLTKSVRKPTSLVHFKRAMSLPEQKIITLIVYHLEHSERDQHGFYYLDKRFVRDIIGWKATESYQDVYDAFENLQRNLVEWNFLGQDRTFDSIACSFLVTVVKPSHRGNKIGFEIHQKLEPLIKDPKVFARFKLVMMVILTKPTYAFPLYELCADSYSRGVKTIQMPLPALKDYLGIASTSYTVFKEFKKFVLKPNIEAINRNSDFSVSYRTYREGRRIGGLIFDIAPQPWQVPFPIGFDEKLALYHQEINDQPGLISHNTKPSPIETDFINSVTLYKVNRTIAQTAIREHGLLGAIEIRDFVLSEVQRRQHTHPIENVGAYLAKCLKQGYGKTSDEERAAKEQQKADKTAQQEAQANKKILDRLKNEVELNRKKRLREVIANLPQDRQQALEKEFAEDVLQCKYNDAVKGAYQQYGFQNIGVRGCYNGFLAKKLLSPFED
ncbi:MAG: replication initiation protein, partial [Candidatus Brocadiales bacterium]|nr:replication initiation protein [Candidatus Brocadiales bacterium]